VAIHQVNTAMELGDVQIALDIGPALDTSGLPTERRVRHALELARAYSARNRRDEGLAVVLDAERLAPEQVRHHYISRQLVLTWMRQRRGRPGIELAGEASGFLPFVFGADATADRGHQMHGSCAAMPGSCPHP
jgi:hypothetical protein